MFSSLSLKQSKALAWAFNKNTKDKYRAIICDGAVRSGKTVVLSTAYVLWAMTNFNKANFAICGKTVGSTVRNVVKPILTNDELTPYFSIEYKRSENMLVIRSNTNVNSFYIFGGKDESAQDLIQGITLSGIMFDEVALMPESFVLQGVARTLSVPNAKLWFNCNPGSPLHWFKTDWIDKAKEKRAYHLHFLMEDNPILTPQMIEDAKGSYTGMFYDRYILGLWVAAEGRVYDCFDYKKHMTDEYTDFETDYYVSCDYGTQNAMVFLLWRKVRNSKIWFCQKEYYYSGREKRIQKTDQEYLDDLISFLYFLYPNKPKKIIVDPSAASFITLLKQNGFKVTKAKNNVLDGIRHTAGELKNNRLKFHPSCVNTREEFESYIWDQKAADRGEDAPVKTNDHAMDAMRYFIETIVCRKSVGMNRAIQEGL